jgi:hypothetical protein
MELPPNSRSNRTSDPDRLVEIASFSHPLEAHLAAALLRTEGIPVSLSGEHSAGLLSGVDAVRLWVREIDRARAVESLAPLAPKAGLPRRSAYFVTGDLEAPRCPRCGGLAVEAERIRGSFLQLARLFLRGLGHLSRPQLQCRLCKARWKPALGDRHPPSESTHPRLPWDSS